jgi:hypothetical protein
MGEESTTNRFRFASEMERIFESEEFSRSPVMRRLLRFLVNQTLAGNGEQLKAYGVAVDGLGRDPDFDAQTDSYPRVQVGRLRRMLDAYYTRAGFGYGYRLTIPNGAYRVHLLEVPAWPKDHQQPVEKPPPPAHTEPSPEPAGQAAATTPSAQSQIRGARRLTGIALILGLTLAIIAVALAYIQSSGRQLSRSGNQSGNRTALSHAPGMLLLATEQGVNSPAGLAPSVDQVLGDAVHRSWVVDVRSSEGAASGARARLDSSRNAYRLQSVLAGPTGEDLYLTLWNNRTDERIWTDHIDLTGRQTSMEEAIRLPVANLIGSFGIIAARERQHYGGDVAPGYACLLKNAEFRMSLEPADMTAAHECIGRTLALDRSSPAILAASALLNYQLYLLEPEKPALKAMAQAEAKAALRLDPFSPDAQMASARIAFAEKRCSLGKALASRAIDLNPYEPEYPARTGMHLFACGDAGHEYLLTLAREMNPQLPAFFSLPVIAAMGEHGRGKEALELAQGLPTANPKQMPFYAITMAVAYANGGDQARAAGIWRQLAASPENAGRTPRQILNALLISPALSSTIGSTLVRAGIIDRLD